MKGASMKHKIIRYSMIILLIGIVALTTVRATARETSSLRELEEFANAVMSLSLGQTLRISVVNPHEPAGPGKPVVFTAMIRRANGSVIARSDEITLAPGEFHSFDFNRADLPLAGEAGTGRLQVRSEIRRRFFPGTAARSSQGNFPGVIELVDNLTGKTQAATSLGKGVYLISSSSQYQAQPSMLGLTPGQTLVASVANLNEGGQRAILRARIRLHDASGALIAQSDELVIPPGEFRSHGFPRSALPLAGEPGADRVQMAVSVLLKLDQIDGDPIEATGSLEIMDDSTGRTMMVQRSYTAGKYSLELDGTSGGW